MNRLPSTRRLVCIAIGLSSLVMPEPAGATPKRSPASGASPAAAKAGPSKDECIDAYTRAQDTRRDGKLLASREALLLCVNESCPKLVRTDCVKRLEELTPALPSVVFEAKDGSGRDLEEVTVTMDGQPLAERLDGHPIEVDPGPHTFVFQTKDLPEVRLSLIIHESERSRREPIVIGSPPPPAPAPLPASPPPVEPAPPPRLSSQKIAALAVAGVGVAALGVGSVFGLIANGKKSDAKAACPDRCTDQSGVDKWNSARSAGNVSTVAFIVGAAALGTGAVLWFTAKPESASAPGLALGTSFGSLQLRGTW